MMHKLQKKRDQYRFYFLCHNLFNFKGGTQVYSAFLLKALQLLHPEADYDLLLKYEDFTSKKVRDLKFLPQTKFLFCGEKFYNTNLWQRRFQSSFSSLKVLRHCFLNRPDLIILTELNYWVILCKWLKQFLDIPYWIVLHGLEAWNIQSQEYKNALQCADRVIAASAYTRKRLLQENYLEAKKVSVLPNTFEPSEFQIGSKPDYLLKRYNLSPSQPVIFTLTRIQRLSRYKGYDQILQALPKIRKHIPNVCYILGGKGDDLPRVEALIRDLNLQNSVILPGFISDSELCDHYNLCDVFAMSSKNEGFGIVFLEALACGKPVLGGNQDGSIEPLANGELGCLVDPDDTEAIANNLIQILQGTYPNPLFYQPEQLRHKTVEKFQFSQFCQTLGDLIQEFETEIQTKRS